MIKETIAPYLILQGAQYIHETMTSFQPIFKTVLQERNKTITSSLDNLLVDDLIDLVVNYDLNQPKELQLSEKHNNEYQPKNETVAYTSKYAKRRRLGK